MNDQEEAIRQRAHDIWEQAGRPEGAAAEHWDEARRQIAAEQDISGADLAETPGQGSDIPLEDLDPDLRPSRDL